MHYSPGGLQTQPPSISLSPEGTDLQHTYTVVVCYLRYKEMKVSKKYSHTLYVRLALHGTSTLDRNGRKWFARVLKRSLYFVD